MYYIGRNCVKQFSQVVDIKTLEILCTVDQDIFHCKRDTNWRVLPNQ